MRGVGRKTPVPPPDRTPLQKPHAHSWCILSLCRVISVPHMSDSEKKLGMCNYCQELGPVYEQEDEHRPLFLVCLRCIKDIQSRIRLDELQQKLRKRRRLHELEEEGYSEGS